MVRVGRAVRRTKRDEMRANLWYCLLALVLVSLWGFSHQPARPNLQLRLILSRKPVQPAFVEGNCYLLTIENGRLRSERKQDGVITPLTDRTFSAEEQAALSGELHRAGAWELADADSKQPESQVLYTYLEVQEGQLPPHRSCWRGLPSNSPHEHCAQVLLGSPFGAQIREALKNL